VVLVLAVLEAVRIARLSANTFLLNKRDELHSKYDFLSSSQKTIESNCKKKKGLCALLIRNQFNDYH
jgi:hypothetical protein